MALPSEMAEIIFLIQSEEHLIPGEESKQQKMQLAVPSQLQCPRAIKSTANDCDKRLKFDRHDKENSYARTLMQYGGTIQLSIAVFVSNLHQKTEEVSSSHTAGSPSSSS